MPRPKKDNPLRRVTVSIDPEDYSQMEEMASDLAAQQLG
jgi:hypothetical protein